MIKVVKLGGSLLETRALPACLDAVERLGGRILIVPGGGLFAEQVRIAQGIWWFDDVAAHRMAVLAMRQMAILFNSLKPEFALFETAAALDGLPSVAVWSPQQEELDSAGIAANWDITSDSLAAWLAGRAGADELLLVKSATVETGTPLAELQRRGIVDAAFNRYAERLSCPITVINKDRFLSTA